MRFSGWEFKGIEKLNIYINKLKLQKGSSSHENSNKRRRHQFINEDQQYATGIKTFANRETVSQVNFDDIEFPVSLRAIDLKNLTRTST